MIAYKVVDLKVGPWNTVLAFFSLAFGVEDQTGQFIGLFTVKDFALKNKADGSGYRIQAPWRKMTDKNGADLLDKEGQKRYLDYFDLYKVEGAGKDGQYGATEAAWKFRHSLTATVVKAYEAVAVSGNKPTPAKQPVAVASQASVGESSKGTPFDFEDDDLPF